MIATFCLIHGKWHDASCWDLLAARLRAAGHSAVAPDLPYEDPQTSHAQRIQPALDAVKGDERRVVVVGHSLGTAYAVWTGIGAFGTALIGIIWFKDPATFWRVAFLVGLIVCLIGLKTVSPEHAEK